MSDDNTKTNWVWLIIKFNYIISILFYLLVGAAIIKYLVM